MEKMLIINLKTYQYGKNAFNLAKKISNVSKKIIIAAQPTDIYLFSKRLKNPIYAQHVNYYKPERNTGYLIPESIKQSGAKGTILNHSEHKLKFNTLEKTIKRCKQVKLKTIVCVSTINEAKKIKKLKPTMMAYEPKELIGTGISVSKTKPDVVKKFTDLLKNTKIIPLCGAGITNREDIIAAKKLGCKGVLLASAITKSSNPQKALKNLIKNA